MFTIPVGDLLASYTWDSKEFSFSGEVFDGYFEDIFFKKDLSFHLRLIALEDGIEAQWSDFSTRVKYENITTDIKIDAFERTWKLNPDKNDPDDIKSINKKDMTIDIGEVIREEIIMYCCNENL